MGRAATPFAALLAERDAGKAKARSAGRRARAAGESEQASPGTSWRFVVEGKPVAMQRPRVVKGRTHTPDETRNYERHVAMSAIAAGVRAGRGPVRLTLDVWMPDRRRRDLDNVLKAVADGLVKAGERVLADDACTVLVEQRVRFAGVDSGRPRVEVTVEMVGGEG